MNCNLQTEELPGVTELLAEGATAGNDAVALEVTVVMAVAEGAAGTVRNAEGDHMTLLQQ